MNKRFHYKKQKIALVWWQFKCVNAHVLKQCSVPLCRGTLQGAMRDSLVAMTLKTWRCLLRRAMRAFSIGQALSIKLDTLTEICHLNRVRRECSGLLSLAKAFHCSPKSAIYTLKQLIFGFSTLFCIFWLLQLVLLQKPLLFFNGHKSVHTSQYDSKWNPSVILNLIAADHKHYTASGQITNL